MQDIKKKKHTLWISPALLLSAGLCACSAEPEPEEVMGDLEGYSPVQDETDEMIIFKVLKSTGGWPVDRFDPEVYTGLLLHSMPDLMIMQGPQFAGSASLQKIQCGTRLVKRWETVPDLEQYGFRKTSDGVYTCVESGETEEEISVSVRTDGNGAVRSVVFRADAAAQCRYAGKVTGSESRSVWLEKMGTPTWIYAEKDCDLYIWSSAREDASLTVVFKAGEQQADAVVLTHAGILDAETLLEYCAAER